MVGTERHESRRIDNQVRFYRGLCLKESKHLPACKCFHVETFLYIASFHAVNKALIISSLADCFLLFPPNYTIVWYSASRSNWQARGPGKLKVLS